MQVTKSIRLTDTIKALTIDQLPDEAWTWIAGGTSNKEAIKRYKDVAWLHRAVNIRADAIGGLPFVFVDGEEEKQPDTIKAVRDIDFDRLFNEIEGDLILCGEAYVSVDRNRFDYIKDLRRMQPSTIKPKYSEQDGSLLYFERRLKSGQPIRLELEDVIYVWLPNREAEQGGGTAPAEVAMSAAGVLNSIDVFGRGFFERGALNSVILPIEGSPDQASIDTMQGWLNRLALGAKNAFRWMVTRAGIGEPIVLGVDFDKLALAELSESKRQDVVAALGVPESILRSNAANFATAQQADIDFYTKTIIPEAGIIESAFNKQLFNKMGIRLKFKPEKLEVFEQREAEKALGMVTLVQSGILTVNEARESMGYEELEGNPEPTPLPEPDEPDVMTRTIRSHIVDAEYETAEDHLKQWERKAKNRLKQGKSLAFGFVSDLIPTKTRADIEGRLATVTDVSDISDIFSNAMTWVNYP